MTGVNAYDGKTGWKIEPFEGKKDAESLSEEELKSIIEDSDLDGPLVNYAQKGNKVEYVGTEPVEGTDAYKLKVTTPDGDVRDYFIDTDYVRADQDRDAAAWSAAPSASTRPSSATTKRSTAGTCRSRSRTA